MKTTPKFPILAMALMLLAAGCKKDKQPSPQHTLLYKATASAAVTTYEYDNSNKPTKFDATFTAAANNYSAICTYNSGGQLAMVLYEKAVGDDIKSIYTYNNSGQITKIETLIVSGGVSTPSLTAQVAYNTPGKVSVYHTPYGGSSYLYTEYFLDANGNNIKQQSYDQAGMLIITSEYSGFDDKHTALHNLPQTEIVKNKNNYTSATVTPTGGTPSTGTFSYEYNNDGYPVKRTSNTGAITTYEYIKR